MDLISVIVPVYRVEKYLERCVQSILNQTYKNIEIILVDDGSPDNCPEICDRLAGLHSSIRVIHKVNGGLSSARNAGIEVCKGAYVSFVYSDDFIDSEFIERLHTLIDKHKADLVMAQYEEVASNTTLPEIRKKTETVYVGKEIEKAFLQLKIDSVCVGLYSKEVINKHRFIEGKTSEDIPFNFEVFRNINRFVFVPERRYYYFFNPESISNGVLDKNMLNYLDFRRQILEYYDGKDAELEKIAKALYARAAFGLQTRMVVYGISEKLNENDCRKEFTKIFKTYKKEFYSEKSIQLSRKIVSIFVFGFYNLIKIVGKIRR